MASFVDPTAVFAEPAPRHERGRVLGQLMGLSLLVWTGLGLLLLAVDTHAVIARVRQEATRITFHAPVLPVPEPEAPAEPRPPEPEPEPVDLTEPTQLAQTVDLPVEAEPEPAPTPVEEAPTPPRRVYGVRKVLARGLGDGTSTARHAGLVVKRGNTLDGVADTLTATAADLRGELAALSTVERAPEPLHRVKPEYSDRLLAARASGVVTARVLVDATGAVASVTITDDFGLDSGPVAAAALRQFRFRPALRRGEPVAVWIIHRIRFEYQES